MVYRGAWRDIGLADRKRCSVCDVCASNKATRRSVPQQREEESTETRPFARVWTDVKGKVTPDFWGNVYCVTFTCEVTRWTVPFVCKLKSEVVEKFKEFLAWTRSHGWIVKQLNSDGGGEYTAPEFAGVRSEFERVCVANGIRQQFTAAHTQSQNGISERLNRKLMEHTRCLLNEAGLSKKFWSLALKHLVWWRNRIWHRALSSADGAGCSPFQMLFGRPPRVSMARVWGCDAWVLDHVHRSSTFEPNARRGLFVGISANRKGWLIFDPATRRVRTSYHVKFDESMENRKCALRQFDLRPRKAGPGASAEEERAALLERQLYVDDGDDLIDENVVDQRFAESVGEISRAGPRRGVGGSNGGDTSADSTGVDSEDPEGGDDAAGTTTACR